MVPTKWLAVVVLLGVIQARELQAQTFRRFNFGPGAVAPAPPVGSTFRTVPSVRPQIIPLSPTPGFFQAQAVIDAHRLFNSLSLQGNPFFFGRPLDPPYPGFPYYYPGMYNPYGGYNGYGYQGYNYRSGGYGSQGLNYGAGYSSYPSGSYGSSSPSYPTTPQPKSAAKEATKELTALGLPSEGGRLNWPLGLRILPPAEKTQALRQQLDALVLLLGQQSGSDAKVHQDLVQPARTAVAELQALLRPHQRTMAETTFQDAQRFLTTLKQVVNKWR